MPALRILREEDVRAAINAEIALDMARRTLRDQAEAQAELAKHREERPALETELTELRSRTAQLDRQLAEAQKAAPGTDEPIRLSQAGPDRGTRCLSITRNREPDRALPSRASRTT